MGGRRPGVLAVERGATATAAFAREMSEQEIQDIFQALEDISPLRRSKALEELRVSVKENHGHLLFGNLKRVFSVLKARLRDSNWNVAHQSCFFFIQSLARGPLGPTDGPCAILTHAALRFALPLTQATNAGAAPAGSELAADGSDCTGTYLLSGQTSLQN